jgi:Helix-turn-helix domain
MAMTNRPREDVDTAIAMYRSGDDLGVIAAFLRIERNSVGPFMRNHSVPARRRASCKISPEERVEILTMFRDGKTVNAIALEKGKPRSTIEGIVNRGSKDGDPTRPREELIGNMLPERVAGQLSEFLSKGWRYEIRDPVGEDVESIALMVSRGCKSVWRVRGDGR